MLRPFARRPARLLALLSCAALTLGACRGSEKEVAPAVTEEASGPRRGGTVVSGWTSEPGGVNELILPPSNVSRELQSHLFLHLFQEQPDFDQHPPTLAPQLAESYEWSPDHKVLTIRLRQDVVWSDGVPVTAEDVRFTWQAQVHPDVVWNSSDMKEHITDVEVADPHTVRFHFARVYAKQMLDVNEGGILPKHVWSKLPFSEWRQSGDWFKANLVVNGPYTVSSWEPQQQVVLVRNPRYHVKDRPYLDRVVMRIVPDQASGLAQMLSGDLDFLAQIQPGDVPQVKASPRLDLVTYWSNLYVAVGWNNSRAPFSDPEIRRALTLAIDRQTIVETILGPYGRIATSPILTMVWAHDKTLKPWPYDPAEARRILAAKGWTDSDGDGVLDKGGKPLSFELLTNAGNRMRSDATVMIQDHLKKVGVQAVPRQIEFNTLIDRCVSGDYEAAIVGFTIDTSLDLTSSYHTRSIDQDNYVRYSNPEVDRLLDTAAAQADILQAKPYLDQIQQIIHRDQPLTFLWESQRLSVVNKRIRDAKPNLFLSFFNLTEWWIEPGT